jgi:uncharacterized coiled-coil DUF342 family protein
MDTEAIRAELKEVQQKIKDMKSSFSTKRDSKEEFFAQGEQYSEEINTLYDEVKEIEKENNLDKINEELDVKKVQYEELKIQLKDVETKFKSVKPDTTPRKPVIKTISVEKAKKELKDLDLKLQTQVLSLDKESEITRKIVQLKEIVGQTDGAEPEAEEDSEYRTLRRDFNAQRRKFNNVEKKIRSFYKQIRLISKEKKKRYKRIDELRALRKQVFDNFKSQKEEYSEVGKDLKDLFKQESEFLEQLGESPRKQSRPRRKPSNGIDSKELKKKQKEVEDNFLKGGTLTTDDLLMFQRKN